MNLTSIPTRKTIALTLTFAFVFMSLRSMEISNQFIEIYCLVTGYYFGRSTALDTPTTNNKKGEKDE